MDLKYGLSSNYLRNSTPFDAVKTFKNFGFNAMELGTKHTAYLLKNGNYQEFKDVISENDFIVPQGHMLTSGDICDPEIIDRAKRTLDMFGEIGVKNAVIHAKGSLDTDEETRFEKLVCSIKTLSEYLKGTDTVLCLENCMRRLIYNADHLNAIIDAAGGGDNLGICLDTGHLNFSYVVDGDPYDKQSQREFILKAGKRLKALHINNNDSMDDDHLLPFTTIENGVDFKEVMTTLEEVNYKGLFNFEIPGEAIGPMEILLYKLPYIKNVAEYMLNKF